MHRLAPTAFGQDEVLLSRDNVLRDPDIPSLGNPKGDISIVEYFDYQCPFCRKIAPELMGVIREDGKVRFVLKDWPIFGGVSVYAAKMVLAAKYQDKYEAAHSALIATTVKLSEATVDELLQKAGVDLDRAKSDLETNKSSLEALLARNDGQARGPRLSGHARLHHRDFPSPRRAESVGVQAGDRGRPKDRQVKLTTTSRRSVPVGVGCGLRTFGRGRLLVAHAGPQP